METRRSVKVDFSVHIKLEPSEYWDDNTLSRSGVPFQVHSVNVNLGYMPGQPWRIGIGGYIRKKDMSVGVRREGRPAKFEELPNNVQDQIREAFNQMMDDIDGAIPRVPDFL